MDAAIAGLIGAAIGGIFRVLGAECVPLLHRLRLLLGETFSSCHLLPG
jgi:hypothetical protein